MNDVSTNSPVVARPAHVTDSVTYDFDMFADAAYVADPHKRILDLVKNAPPIFWTPRNGGHWMLMSHSANFNASRDTEGFSSEIVPQAVMKMMMAQRPAGSPHIPMPLPITIDPPQHTAYRAPLQRAFSPKAMMELTGSIRELAIELIEKLKAKGCGDFLEDVAEPLPVQVFLKMFGLPVARQQEYRTLVKEHMEGIKNPDPRSMVARMLKLTAIMRETVLERKENPKDDLISMLWKSEINGQPTTLEDLENYCVVLFTAGLDTVVNGISLGVTHMAKNAELQNQLRANPADIQKAAEEMLRRYTFTVPLRRVAKDMNFQGVELKTNDRVMLFLPAADLDSSEYPEADRFNMGRENSVHIAFGAGPHRCLGSHLARLELQIVYAELLARIPEFRLDPDKPVTYHGGHVVGPDAVWLRWN